MSRSDDEWHCQAGTRVDATRPQRKRTTEKTSKRDPEKEMQTAGFRYSCSKMEVAVQHRAGWRQVILKLNTVIRQSQQLQPDAFQQMGH